MIPNPADLGGVPLRMLDIDPDHVSQSNASALGMSTGVIKPIRRQIDQEIVVFGSKLKK